MDYNFTKLAYSRNFPDGLCGGTLAYAIGAPMLLTNVGAEAVASEYVSTRGVTGGIVLGGTASMPNKCANTVFETVIKV